MAGKSTKHSSRDWSKVKIALLLSACFLVLGGLWARTADIQILRGDELAAQAEKQYFSQEKIQGKRGEIFDRKGRVLAQSVRSKSVYANPVLMEDIRDASQKLSRALEMEAESIRSKLAREKSFVWIQRKISDRSAHAVEQKEIPGVFIIDEHTRVYPQKHMLGQVLGFTGVDNTGLEGLEKSLDQRLSGAEMLMVMQRDASGNRFTLVPQEPARDVDGEDIYLTIDSRVQFTAEEALKETVEEYQGDHGIAMVVHVPTGDIRAWAQYPFFNPNNFRQSSPALWRNRAATDLYEPGSTLKPFLVAAVLEQQVARSDSLYFCEEGSWALGNNRIKDVHDHGWLTVSRVLRYSSNIGASKLGLDLGAEKYHRYLRKLGLDTPTQLPLPAQNKGLLRPPRTWSQMDLATISFGQGMASSFLQLAEAYLTLANDGVYTELNLLREESSSKPSGARVFSREVSREVRRMLKDAVERDGTGTRANISGVQVAGKTGTAQKASSQGGYKDEYISSFVGFLPAMDPEYMVMVLVDEPKGQHYGGIVAAPAFKRIGNRLLPSQNTPGLQAMSLEQSEHKIQSVHQEDSTRFHISSGIKQDFDTREVPDLRGVPLRTAVKNLLKEGIAFDLEGKGVVVREQSPAPGSSWDEHTREITLKLSSGF